MKRKYDPTRKNRKTTGKLVPVGIHDAVLDSVCIKTDRPGYDLVVLNWWVPPYDTLAEYCHVVKDETTPRGPAIRRGEWRIAQTLEAGDRAMEFDSLDDLKSSLVGIQARIRVEHEADQNGVPTAVIKDASPVPSDHPSLPPSGCVWV